MVTDSKNEDFQVGVLSTKAVFKWVIVILEAKLKSAWC